MAATANDYIAKAMSMYEQTNGVVGITADERDSSVEITKDGLGAYVEARIWIESDDTTAKLHALREGLMLALKMANALNYEIVANDVGLHLSTLERIIDEKRREV